MSSTKDLYVLQRPQFRAEQLDLPDDPAEREAEIRERLKEWEAMWHGLCRAKRNFMRAIAWARNEVGMADLNRALAASNTKPDRAS